MICIRVLAFTCLAAHAVETVELTESVSLLQTGVSKKKNGPNIVKLVMGPPWAKVDPADFNALKAAGAALLNRTALELDLSDKEAEGELPEGMRFSLAGKHEEQDVDLLITAVTRKEAQASEGVEQYNSGKLKTKKKESNGLYKGLARVFLKTDTTQTIKMSVVKHGTTEPLKIPLLALTFFSLGGFGKGGKNNPTTVSDCNTDLVSEFWAAPNVMSDTKSVCGGVAFRGTGQLKPNGKGDPKSVAEVGDLDCPNSFVLKWFDAKEITLELTVGKPSKRTGAAFMFKVGLTKCDATWEPPPTKQEKKAVAKAQKAAEKAVKDAEKEAAAILKAEEKKKKDEEKAKAAEEKAKAAEAKAAAKAAKAGR